MPNPAILIIDDDREILRLTELALRSKGYEVRSSNDARHGLIMALSETPDLIMLDYMMPERDGLSILKDIRQVPELENIPVIMFTASSNPEVVTGAIHQHVNDFLVKPFSIQTLFERVGKLLPPPDVKTE